MKNNERIQARVRIARDLLTILRVRKEHVFWLVVISIVVAALDGIGLGLLVPLAEGVVAGDFTQVTLPPALQRPLLAFLSWLEIDIRPAVMFFSLASIIFGINLLSILLGLLNATYGQYLRGIYLFNLHTFVYNQYFTFGKLFFDQTSQGSIKKILEYTTRIVALVRILQNNLANFTRLGAHLVVMFFLSWQLMLLILLVFPILYYLSRFIMSSVDKHWQQAKDITLEVGRESFNILSALPLVWSYSQEDAAKKKYAALNERFRRVELRAQVLGDVVVTIPRLITLAALLAVVGFITYSIEQGNDPDLARMVIFLYVASRTVPLFKVFNTVWVVISEMSPPILEILRLVKTRDEHIVRGGDKTFTGLTNTIRFDGLRFTYGGREQTLEDVSFEIKRGTLVALVGPSGAGKSTLIHLLMRFYDSPHGAIFFDNVDIHEFTLASLRKHIALVDQEPLLLNDTLHNNLVYGLEKVSQQDLAQAVAKARLEELVARLPKGLATVIGDRGVQLSGGEKQRVAIARALLKGSEIILLDEATSALDSATEKHIQKALIEVTTGRTAIVVAHRLSTIEQADTIVYLENGTIREQGTLEELLKQNGPFAKQWSLQRGVH